MENINTVTELIYCENVNVESGCKFGASLWNDEVTPGNPSVIIDINGESHQIALRDVVMIVHVLESLMKEVPLSVES